MAATIDDVDRLRAFVRSEQYDLWTDLDEAITEAINGVWSIKAYNLAQRIVWAAELVGPTEHDKVSWLIIAGGVYEAVLRAGELPVVLPDEAEWAQLEVLMAEYGSRQSLRAKFAGTVAAIAADTKRIKGRRSRREEMWED